MKIATFGSGHIGGTLGKLWAAKGHNVMFCSRSMQSAKMQALLQEAGPNAKLGTIVDGFDFAEVILLALPPSEIESVLERIGDFRQKILINSTNRRDGKSADAEVIRLAKNARVVRAFNSLAWEVLQSPQYNETNASMFFSGDDSSAKQVVVQLCRDIGLDPVDVGPSANSTLVEAALGSLWTVLSPRLGRGYSLRVLRRGAT